MAKYCCFLCPCKNYEDRSLTDVCPTCGHKYGFPLDTYPNSIGGYTVVDDRGRGFYGATYLCQRGNLNRRYILKVTPVAVYEFFGKRFIEECEIHRDVAADSEHIVPIYDFFDETLVYNDMTIPCHIAVLDFVDGTPLDEYLEKQENTTPRAMAQIAIDLLRIWQDFSNKLKRHNDLHANNILVQTLRGGARRAEAIEPSIRAIAIDLGSVGDESKSDACGGRLGDQHWLASHFQRMIGILRGAQFDIDGTDDLEIRLSEALERIYHLLLPPVLSGKTPSEENLIRMVRDEFYRVDTYSPWATPLRLERFDDYYNALALESWHVPFLLVDPDNLWVRRISTAGPLLITGMRGCGKTMLLRALDFHARAAIQEGDSVDDVVRLVEDGYVGLSASCVDLLTTPGRHDITSPLERLFVAYCLEAIRALRHLQELRPEAVVPHYYEFIEEALRTNLALSITEGTICSGTDLERFILRLSPVIKGMPDRCVLQVAPAEAFRSLAGAIRRCSSIWSNAKIFYLLDDLSTRYLREDKIEFLFNALVFQSPECAFKITTESQTLELALYSPGFVERAREGRDYEVFDLGAEVYEKTKSTERQGKYKLFIEDILNHRAAFYPNHPKVEARELLGDCSLEDIARKIVQTSASSRERKAIYHGISALSALCVGDIGDVIKLYEMILRKAKGRSYPISPEIQSECYQQLCGLRLYDLARRESILKDFARSFSEAAYTLLVKSHRAMSTKKRKRLRQFTSIYVRVTSGDTEEQFKKLRTLIDAGLFVFFGGAPRTKTRDRDPIAQFKLVYRKLFGLASFIGLAESDRFELSGENLETWLKEPLKGKEILLRNQIKDVPPNDATDDAETLAPVGAEHVVPDPRYQADLFASLPRPTIGDLYENGHSATQEETPSWIGQRLSVTQVPQTHIKSSDIDLVVLGLGFEDRTLESVRRLFSQISAKTAILVKYAEPGRSKEILDIVGAKVGDIRVVDYDKTLSEPLHFPKASALVDVTGLAKPALFAYVREILRETGVVWVSHTQAEDYYPLNSAIEEIFAAEDDREGYGLLDGLSRILTGEKPPYSIRELINTNADESRYKLLCAFSSAKHQRLLSLLDQREYDRIEIVIPPEGPPRNRIARIASEIATLNLQPSGKSVIESDDLEACLEFLCQQYERWYIERGYNVEFGLTGSKMQAVACAAVSVVCKVAHCWYVCPQEFDPNRFTKGIGESRYFQIRRAGFKEELGSLE